LIESVKLREVSSLPLTTLLSQALVAFTIEFDNEFEHRMPHRSAASKRRGERPRGPWLVSQVMWANVLKYLADQGTPIAELHARARTTKDSLSGLTRWGYITVTDDVMTPTGWTKKARKIWAPLAGEIEQRWLARFGAATVGRLRAALENLAGRLDLDLPDYLPITSPTQNGKLEMFPPLQAAPDVAGLDLSVLLSRALLTYTLDFERGSAISLPVCANTLRVLGAEPTLLRDLPRLSGVSREGQNMATGFLARIGCAAIEPASSGGRGKAIRLTEKGLQAKANYRRQLAATDRAMSERFGADIIDPVRAALESIVGGPILQHLQAYPDGWRAARPVELLPHHPLVLHRGGYPDGS
jgi:hypothetical protein